MSDKEIMNSSSLTKPLRASSSMLDQPPSARHSQNIGHVLTKIFRQSTPSQHSSLSDYTVKNLKTSLFTQEGFHYDYANTLITAYDKHQKINHDLNAVEKHMIDAQSTALMNENRHEKDAEIRDNLFLPSQQSHLRFCVDYELMRSNGLIIPNDLEKINSHSVVKPPQPPAQPNYLSSTQNVEKSKNDSNEKSNELLPQLAIDHDENFSDSSMDEIEFYNRLLRPKKQYSELPDLVPTSEKIVADWRGQLAHRDRVKNRNDLGNLERRIDYLRNPRHEIPSQLANASIIQVPKSTLKTRTTSKHSKCADKTIKSTVNLPQDKKTESTPVFISDPVEVLFEDYERGKIFEKSLSIRNVSTASRSYRLVPPATSYFSITFGEFPGKNESFLAPGMSAKYIVKFSPDSLANFDDSVKILSQASISLVISLKGFRPSPVLNLAKNIYLGHCLIGSSKEVTFPVKNSGGFGRFIVASTDVKPKKDFNELIRQFENEDTVKLDYFSIRPRFLFLSQKSLFSSHINIRFTPPPVNQSSRHDETNAFGENLTEEFALICDNCEEPTKIKLHGTSRLVDLQFVAIEGGESQKELGDSVDQSAQHYIKFDDLNPYTYHSRTITISNNIDLPLQYQWIITKPNLKFDTLDNSGTNQNCEQNRIVDLSNVFTVHPSEGFLPPFQILDFSLSFAPPKVSEYHCAVQMIIRNVPYDSVPNEFKQRILSEDIFTSSPDKNNEQKDAVIQQAKSLLERNQNTEGATVDDFIMPNVDINLQPLISFAAITLDTKATCISHSISIHPNAIVIPSIMQPLTAEKRPIELVNNSLAPIIFEWEVVGNEQDGLVIEVSPGLGEISSNNKMSLQLTVCSSKPGPIDQIVHCKVQHHEYSIPLRVQAEISGPILSVSDPEVNLGLLKINEVYGRKFFLCNVSQIPAHFSLEVQKEDQVISKRSAHSHDISFDEKAAFAEQFIFQPTSGIINPLERKGIVMSFTPNNLGHLDSIIIIHVDDGDDLFIKLRGDISAPRIYLSSSRLSLDREYFNIQSIHKIKLVNQSAFEAKYSWNSCYYDEATLMLTDDEKNSSLIEKKELVEVERKANVNICDVCVVEKSGVIPPYAEIDCEIFTTPKFVGQLKGIILACHVEEMKTPIALSIDVISYGLSVRYSLVDNEHPDNRHFANDNNLCIDFGTVALGSVARQKLYVENETAIPTQFNLIIDHFPASNTLEHDSEDKQTNHVSHKVKKFARPEIAKLSQKTDAEIYISMLKNDKGLAFLLIPMSGSLNPFEKKCITISVYSDMWGSYSDKLIIQVGDLPEKCVNLFVNIIGNPLKFQMTAGRKDIDAVMRFGTHQSNGKIVIRPSRVYNTSPFDIRLDWKIFNDEKIETQFQHRQQLIDSIFYYGEQAFALKDENDEELPYELEDQILNDLENNKNVASDKYSRPNSSFISNSPDSSIRVVNTSMSNRSNTSIFPSAIVLSSPSPPDESSLADRRKSQILEKRPRLVHLILNQHDGKYMVEPLKPFAIEPKQIIVPRRGNAPIKLLFDPAIVKNNDDEQQVNSFETNKCDVEEVSGFGLGYVSLDDTDIIRKAKLVERCQGYQVDSLRLNLSAYIQPAMLDIENDDGDEDEGFRFRFSMSDIIIETKQVVSNDEQRNYFDIKSTDKIEKIWKSSWAIFANRTKMPLYLKIELPTSDNFSFDEETSFFSPSVVVTNEGTQKSLIHYRFNVIDPHPIIGTSKAASQDKNYKESSFDLVIQPGKNQKIDIGSSFDFENILNDLFINENFDDVFPPCDHAEIMSRNLKEPLRKLSKFKEERKIHICDFVKITYANGAIQRIPLYSTIVLPSFILSHEELDFGKTLVGQQKEKEIFISNPTMSVTYWEAFINDVTHINNDGVGNNDAEKISKERNDLISSANPMIDSSDALESMTIFSLNPSKGKLNAHMTYASLGTKMYLRICFCPVELGDYSGLIEFNGCLGEESKTLLIKGCGTYDEKHEGVLE